MEGGVSDKTDIEWTDATWNPTTGCSKVSPGCAHCYAERLSLRFGHSTKPWTPANANENVQIHEDRFDLPLRWREPRRIFVDSMSDLFHELVPEWVVARIWETMAEAPRHEFQILTKRPERMPEMVARRVAVHGVLPNVWLGTSIENDRWVGRANDLRATPAAVRFISAEPLLGPLDSLDLTDIDWLIVGGESGSNHRPLKEGWVRDLRDRAQDVGTAFFFKQWGGRTPKAGGRTLDGQTWDQFPVLPHQLPEAALA
jgi:protein gp37